MSLQFADGYNQAIDDLTKLEWFSIVGQPLEPVELFGKCNFVSSWDEAMSPKIQRSYDLALQDCNIEMVLQIGKNCPALMNTRSSPNYKDYGVHIANTAECLCNCKMEGFTMFTKSALFNVLNTIKLILFSLQFREYHTVSFGFELLNILKSGHYPCGYTTRKYVTGNLIVF